MLMKVCRSPMAEAVFRDMVEKRGIAHQFEIDSAATCSWEVGNPVHHGTRNKLREVGISTEGMRARQVVKEDLERFDYIFGMETQNIKDILSIFEVSESPKVKRLLDIVERPRNIADPWHTGDFETTYVDVLEGCEKLLQNILEDTKN